MKIINHYPSINATGIFRNEPIKVYFDVPIDATSIAWDTFSINDSATFASVVGEIGPLWESGINLSGVSSGIVFIPTLNLLPNTEYSVYVYGAPNSIVAKNHSQLQETYSYSFVTGTGYYDAVGVVGTPTGVLEDISLLDLSGIPITDETLIDSFIIYSTNPKNQKPNVETQLSGIYITFTGNILTSNISNYILVEESSVI